jgi:Domain of unknown function (DUF4326)
VYVVSLGQVREAALRPLKCTDKSKWEYLYPAHGSLYVLPHENNITHEHAILDQDFPCSLRISINCKHIAPRVFDCHKGKQYPPGAVYVGREVIRGGKLIAEASPFGNELPDGHNGPEDYRRYAVQRMQNDEEWRLLVEGLRGKNLKCWCKTGEGHCGVLLELANA